MQATLYNIWECLVAEPDKVLVGELNPQYRDYLLSQVEADNMAST